MFEIADYSKNIYGLVIESHLKQSDPEKHKTLKENKLLDSYISYSGEKIFEAFSTYVAVSVGKKVGEMERDGAGIEEWFDVLNDIFAAANSFVLREMIFKVE